MAHRSGLALAAAGLATALLSDKQIEAEARCEGGASPATFLTANFIADAAEKATPALVNITVNNSFSKSSGSGFIIDGSGVILTNTHVVQGALEGGRFRGGGTVIVTLSDGTPLQGVVQSADPVSDIAIVKVRAERPLPTAKLGSSAGL